MTDLLSFYGNLLSPRLDLQTTLNTHLQNTSNLISSSIRLLSKQETPFDVKQVIAICSKNLIETQWDSLLISQLEKKSIVKEVKKSLPAVIDNRQLTILLSEVLASINNTGFQTEDSLFMVYEEFLKEEKNRQNGFLGLTRVLELSDCSRQLTDDFIAKLSELFMAEETSLQTREMLLTVVFLFAKKTIQSEFFDFERKQEKLEFLLEAWNSVFQMILASKDGSMALMKFYVVNVYICLMRDTQIMADQKHMAILSNILKCMLNGLNALLTRKTDHNPNTLLYILDDNLYYIDEVDALVMALCELIENICFFEPLKDFFKNALFMIFCTLVFYAINNEEDKDDVVYVRVRSGVVDTISTIIDRHDNVAIKTLDELISFHLDFNISSKLLKNRFDELKPFFKTIGFDMKTLKLKPFNVPKTFYIGKEWKAKELGLFLLDRFKEDVIGYRSLTNTLDENDIIKQLAIVLKEETKEELIIKALESVSLFRYTHNVDNNLFFELFKTVSTLISTNKHYDIRVLASKSIGILSFRIATNKLFTEINSCLGEDFEIMFYNVFDLLEKASLDGFISSIDNFLLIYDVNKDKFTETMDKDHIDRFIEIYKRNLTNKMTVPLFYDILTRLLKNNEVRYYLLEKLVTLFSSFVVKFNEEKDGHESFEQIINVLLFASKQKINFTTFTPTIKQLSTVVSKTQFPSIKLKFTVFIKNLILFDLIKEEANKEIVTLLEELYLNQVSLTENEANCCYVGSVALTLYTKTQLPNKLEFLTSLLRKLNKSALPLTNQGIAIFISFLLLTEPAVALSLLTQIQVGAKFGLKILFDHWLLHQPKFTGPNVKTITIKALIQVLMSIDPGLKGLYVVGLRPSHKHASPELPLPLRILSLLKEIAEHETAALQKQKRKNMSTNQMRDFYLEEDGRMETEMEDGDSFDDDCNNSLDIDINIDYEGDSGDFEFNGGNGLAGIETGSQSYMSALLGFDDIDGGDFDENSEGDVLAVGIEEVGVLELISKGLKGFVGGEVCGMIWGDIDEETRKFVKETVGDN